MRSQSSILILIIVVISCFQEALAQHTPDSITRHYDSLSKIKLQELDKSNPKANHLNSKVDSLQLRLNNILNPNFNKLTSKLSRKKLAPTDTIRASHELDSTKHALNTKIDSLKQFNLPTEKYTRKLDSINNISPQKYIELANSKITDAENKINQPIGDIQNKLNKPVSDIEGKINKPIDNVEAKINDKLNVMRQEGGDKANIPGTLNTKDLSLDKTKLTGADINKDLSLNTDINKPDISTPALDKPDINNPLSNQTGQLGELKDKVNDVKTIPQQQIDKVKSIDEIKSVQDKVGDANKAIDNVQSIKTDPNAIENKAKELDEVKELSKQTAEIDKAKGMIDKGKDPEAMKDMAKQEIRKQAVDHFKGKEQALQAAMDKLSKLKEKYPEVSSIKDLPKRPPNPMKGKPLIERIVPGLTLQIQKMNHVQVDINPVVSYRFSGRVNAGIGWNERLSFTKWNKLSPPERIYGPRVFGSFAFKKGFSAKAEIEKMNTVIPPSPISPDGSRQWVWSAFVGIKKDYKFMGSVRGNVQMLYNIYDDHDNSPYVERLNVRMGFEFPMKKVRKPIK